MPTFSLDRYKVFGCNLENHVPKEARPPESMWDKRTNRTVYVGTDWQSGYEFWDLRNQRFDHTHNCTILENEFPTSDDFPQAELYQRRRRGENVSRRHQRLSQNRYNIRNRRNDPSLTLSSSNVALLLLLSSQTWLNRNSRLTIHRHWRKRFQVRKPQNGDKLCWKSYTASMKMVSGS